MTHHGFQVNDVVDVKGRSDITNYGTIVAMPNRDQAQVKFRTPKQPKKRNICDSCGFPHMLSQNGGTGEITCMRSGCGHDHGFDERTELVDYFKLINITAQRTKERRGQWTARLQALLAEGVRDHIITESQQDTALGTCANLDLHR